MVGSTISHYKILEKLGEGGMGVVYKAHDLKLDRLVALKFLPHHLSANEEEKKRFIHEAKAASALDHPNICVIHEIDETKDGQMFIAMAYYGGKSLQEMIGTGEGTSPIRLGDAIDYAIQIAQGLMKAHEHGIVHRDLKPANVIITEEGVVKLVDFGLAKLVGRTKLTKIGTTMGTVAYMSPEQARGEQVDTRSDIWSFGVVLYEMLTGKLPFRGDYEQAVIYSILNEEPKSVSTLCSSPPALSAIVHKTLAKNSHKRYQNMEEVISDLRRLETDKTRIIATSRRHLGLPRIFLLSASIVTLVLIIVWTVFHPTSQPTDADTLPNRQAIAVLPFTVRGGVDYAYLGEGMVDLMSTKLDGAGGWRSVDPRAVLGVVAQQGKFVPSPEDSRAIARKLNSGFYVLGNIVEVAGKLQLHASLYNADAGPQAIAHGAASGMTGELFKLVDEVAAQLIVGQSDEPGERVTQIAAVTTHSLSALKAYLEGEEAFRTGKFVAALDAFQRATNEDTSFALAWYKLSVAAEWNTQSKLAREAANKAFQYSNRLSKHDRQMLEAFALWRGGKTVRAEELYRTVVAVYPDDVEAWFQLGEVLFHQNPLRGHSISESRGTWEKVLFFEPDHLQALWHLARIPAKTSNTAELDEFVKRIVKLNPEGDRVLEMLALQAFVEEDTAAQKQVLVDLRQARESTLILAVWNVTVYSDNPLKAWPLAELMVEPSRSLEARALGHTWLGYLELIRGKLKNAEGQLAAAGAQDPTWRLVFGGILPVAPFLSASREQAEKVHQQLLAWRADAVPASKNPGNYFTVHDDLYQQIRFYLLGLISARIRDSATAFQYLKALDKWTDDPDIGTLTQDMQLSIQAQIALSKGRFETALANLEEMQLQRWYNFAFSSPFYSQAFDRYQRAELLKHTGRIEEAMVWYNSFEENSVYDLIYLPPSHFHRAEIYEALGQPQQAIEHYAAFLEFWRDCDPELRPMVEKAQSRLRELQKDKNE